ncbi:unnamed protein product [Brassicogethes aeneus]|uniref:DUF7041 domain-containing protein n=1 Tax=Brassicogethes aeneus TaxID=1431903 RepID=A0A9P0B6F7_BRAAE|nr:unnamed protein product [Brassicogethes aeneus]
MTQEGAGAHEVHRVSFKAPEFWKSEPELWFHRIECQFRTAGITTDNSKFDYTVASLSCEVLSEVAEIVRNPPADDKYKTIKERLVARFADSDVKKTQKLFSTLTLGDQ